MDDHELWGPIRGRDASAEAFYRDNAARLCAFLRQLVGSPQAAEGLMQETFTHMWKSPNGFRPRAREWQPQGSPGVETVVQKKRPQRAREEHRRLRETGLRREREAIGVDERAEIGGDFRGYSLEFVGGGIAGQFKALGGGVGSYGDDGTVARVRGGRTCEFVERLLRLLQVVDADIEDDVRAHRFAADKQSARAVLLIGFGKDPAEAHALLRKGCPGGEPARVVASLCESADDVVRDGVDQGVGLIGGRFFCRSV